jgi:conjugative relaxase-like TrwC/TraI family protein
MLSIGKLGAGRPPVEYYIGHVAQGVEDYYTGAGEAPGQWLGAGAALLGLEGVVEPGQLRSVMAGDDPNTGDPLSHNSGRREVPGFDATFSATKSTSLLYAFGDEHVRAECVAAHDAAVEAVLTHYLEPHVILTRRGAGGKETMPTTGAVAAAFRHRTSRAGDPVLHTHLLIANIVQGVDGRWSALHGGLLYTNAKTGGYLYHAHLRDELTHRLGVQWGPVHNGTADIIGVDRETIRHFSRRSEEIKAELARRVQKEEINSPDAAKVAQQVTLETRKGKEYGVEGETLQQRWEEHGAEIGFGRDNVAAWVGHTAHEPVSKPTRRSIYRDLVSADGLTAEASTFSRPDISRAIAERLPQGASVPEVEAWTSEFLRSQGVVTVAEPLAQRHQHNALRIGRLSQDRGHVRSAEDVRRDRIVVVQRDEIRYSTTTMLALEKALIDSARGRRRAGVAIAAEDAVQAALERRPTLNAEQRAMVVGLTSSGAGVEVVSAAAGAGKTFSLDAAREAWEATGHRVIGAGVAARYAAELNKGAGIESFTVDRLLLDVNDPRTGGLVPNTVLVVDEAGTLGTRRARALLELAERYNAKLILVGDPHQLPSIDAGGVLRGLSRRLGFYELRENMRQRDSWERDAASELRDGDVVRSIASYAQHGRIVTADTAPGLRERLVDDWWQARQSGKQVIIFARRNDDANDLNRRARARYAAAGLLAGDTLWVGNKPFQAGERVMTARNSLAMGVRNGTFGHVVDVDTDARTARLELDNGKRVTLSRDYLDAGHLRHGYAISTYKSQGMTVDEAFFLGDEGLYREMAYTGMTRGIESNRFYLTAGETFLAEDLAEFRAEDKNPLAEATRMAQRSKAKELAVDFAGESGFAALPLADLYAQRDAIQRELRRAPKDPATELDRVRLDQAGARTRLVDLRTTAPPEDAPRRVRLDHNALVAEWRERAASLQTKERQLARQEAERSRFVDAHRPQFARLEQLEGVITRREAKQISRSAAAAPPYVVTSLGPRPDGAAGRQVWKQGVAAIESYRLRHRINDPDRALGGEPRSAAARADYLQTSSRMQTARDALAEPAAPRHREYEPTGLQRTRELRRPKPDQRVG